MKYNLIIQELKQSPDSNVRAFVKDAEKIQRLSPADRKYFLTHIHDPNAVGKLINGYIPYIIRVAYAMSLNTNRVSILELINEGIIGAYAAILKYHQRRTEMLRPLRVYVHLYMASLIYREMCYQRGIAPHYYYFKNHNYANNDFESRIADGARLRAE